MILDGDDRLIGKGRNQLDVLVRKRSNLEARKEDNANRYASAQERYTQHRPIVPDAYDFVQLVFGIVLNIADLERSPIQQNSTNYRSSARRKSDTFKIRCVFHPLFVFARDAEACGKTEDAAFRPPDIRDVRLA